MHLCFVFLAVYYYSIVLVLDMKCDVLPVVCDVIVCPHSAQNVFCVDLCF